jgi:hypothetical protein
MILINMVYQWLLVGGFNLPLWQNLSESQWWWNSQLNGKVNFMFQSTNQPMILGRIRTNLAKWSSWFIGMVYLQHSDGHNNSCWAGWSTLSWSWGLFSRVMSPFGKSIGAGLICHLPFASICCYLYLYNTLIVHVPLFISIIYTVSKCFRSLLFWVTFIIHIIAMLLRPRS